MAVERVSRFYMRFYQMRVDACDNARSNGWCTIAYYEAGYQPDGCVVSRWLPRGDVYVYSTKDLLDGDEVEQ